VADEHFHISIAMVTRNPVLKSAYQSFATANAIGEWASIR
jgi:DNA-binding FadR family transcriptional regulator